jgi:hypothetical protein
MTLEILKPEIEYIADDVELSGEMREEFVKQVCNHIIDNNIDSWDYVYSYVDGLLVQIGF